MILVRDAADGLQTFMVRRHSQTPVNPNVYVFPGGTVHARDEDPSWPDPPDDLAARSDTSLNTQEARAVYTCAVRELFEEAGVLLVRDAPDHVLAVNEAEADRLAAGRSAVQSGERPLKDLLGAWQPAFDLLVPFSHWVTPVAAPARFDTWFFVAVLPARQVALHLEIETSDGVWLSPRQLLDDAAYRLVFATEQHIRRLAPYGTVADLLAFARGKPIRRLQPDLVEDPQGHRFPRLDPALIDAW